MMDVTLSFVSPGGGETDHEMQYRLPALPRAGDYISIKTKEADKTPATRDYIVRRVWWSLQEPTGPRGMVGDGAVIIECEFALNSTSSASHKSSCDMYDVRAQQTGRARVKSFDESCY